MKDANGLLVQKTTISDSYLSQFIVYLLCVSLKFVCIMQEKRPKYDRHEHLLTLHSVDQSWDAVHFDISFESFSMAYTWVMNPESAHYS